MDWTLVSLNFNVGSYDNKLIDDELDTTLVNTYFINFTKNSLYIIWIM